MAEVLHRTGILDSSHLTTFQDYLRSYMILDEFASSGHHILCTRLRWNEIRGPTVVVESCLDTIFFQLSRARLSASDRQFLTLVPVFLSALFPEKRFVLGD